MGSKRSRPDEDRKDEDRPAASSGFELLLWFTMQAQLFWWETQDAVAAAPIGGGASGNRAGRQIAAGAKPGGDTAPGLAQAASAWRAVHTAHGKTEATPLLMQAY